MAQIKPVLVVRDEPAGTQSTGVTTQTFAGVAKLSIEWALSAPEAMSYEANGAHVGILTPGVPPAGTRTIGFSLDNAANIDARMLSGGSQTNDAMPATVTESGKSIAAALETTHIPRSSAQQINIVDAFKGKRGLTRVSGSPGGQAAAKRMLTGGLLPYFQGIESTKVGLPGAAQAASFAFTWVFPSRAVATLPLDIDINRDTLDRATLSTAEHLGSAVDPQRAQYVIDSGDYGINHAAPKARTVTVGNLGTTVQCTFQNYDIDGTAQPILAGEGTTVAPQTLQMLASASLIGGDTHHGLPGNGKITDIVTLNQTDTDATGDYRSGIPVVSFYGDRNHGGVYYWPGDGLFHPLSQAMGVNRLWYDERGLNNSGVPLIYAATDAGIYSQVADPTGASREWPRLGNMALKCLKVISADATYALVEDATTSTRHVLKYDPNNAVNGYGFDDWISIYSNGGMFDFGILVSNGGANVDLYALSDDSSGKGFYHVHPIVGGGADQTLPIVQGDTIVGIGMDTIMSFSKDPVTHVVTGITQGIYLRTDSGSPGLFWLTPGGGKSRAANGLKDAGNADVMVNSVAAHSTGYVKWDLPAGKFLTKPVVAIAATSAGIFVAAKYTGPWQATDGQSNLGDIDVLRAAGAPPRQWAEDAPTPLSAATPPKRTLTRFYGVSDRALYVSNDGTISWVDALQKPLDEGPFFFATWKARTGHFPNNNDTFLKYPDPGSGPFVLIRRLDGLSQFTYRLINPNSSAPAGAHRDAELSYISSAAYVPEVPLSEQLVAGEMRLLNYTASPQTIIEMVSWFDDDADALRFLRPTHLVHVNGTITSLIVGVSTTPVGFTTLVNAPFYVLKHRIEYDVLRGGCFTFTRLGTLCLDDRTDASKVTSDLFYALSREQLFRSRGHH